MFNETSIRGRIERRKSRLFTKDKGAVLEIFQAYTHLHNQFFITMTNSSTPFWKFPPLMGFTHLTSIKILPTILRGKRTSRGSQENGLHGDTPHVFTSKFCVKVFPSSPINCKYQTLCTEGSCNDHAWTN
jgi:hypothetical protein